MEYPIYKWMIFRGTPISGPPHYGGWTSLSFRFILLFICPWSPNLDPHDVPNLDPHEVRITSPENAWCATTIVYMYITDIYSIYIYIKWITNDTHMIHHDFPNVYPHLKNQLSLVTPSPPGATWEAEDECAAMLMPSAWAARPQRTLVAWDPGGWRGWNTWDFGSFNDEWWWDF